MDWKWVQLRFQFEEETPFFTPDLPDCDFFKTQPHKDEEYFIELLWYFPKHFFTLHGVAASMPLVGILN